MYLFFLLNLLLLTGCGHIISDPSENGDVARCPRIIFQPQCFGQNCDDPVEVDLEKEWALSDLIDLGLQTNPSTKQAWAIARSQAFNLYASRSLYLPVVDVQESVIWNDTKFHFKQGDSFANVGLPDATTTGFSGFTVSYPTDIAIQYLLFDFGTRSGTIEANKQALMAANWDHHFTLQNVIYNVSKAYYDYLEAQAFVESNIKNLENAKIALEAAEAQFNVGIKTKVDSLQARTNYYNAEIELENKKAAEKVAMARLMQMVGLPPDIILKIQSIPFTIEPKPIEEGIEYLVEKAKEQRADLASKEALVWRSDAQIDVAWGNALPTLSANALLNRTFYSHSPITSSHSYTGALVLDIPLFEGFFDYNQIRKAKSDYEVAYYDWKNSEEAVLVDVIASYYQYITSNVNLKTAAEYKNFAEESFEAIYEGYKEGIQTILDLLSAQNVLADARARYIQSRASWLRAIVNIAFTTGLLGVNADELSIATPEMRGDPCD